MTKLTPKKRRAWKPIFLQALRASPNVTAAARSAGLSREHVYNTRERDATFAKQWDDALEQSTDKAVGEAYRRAVKGVLKPVFGSLGGNKGNGQIGKVREFSDTLMIFLLKAHRPEIYRERIEIDNRRIDDEIERALETIAALGKAGDAGAASGAHAVAAGNDRAELPPAASEAAGVH